MPKNYNRKTYRKKEKEEQKRWGLLSELDELTDAPLSFLSVIWLGLVVYDLVYGMDAFLEGVFYLIWGFFILHFSLELALSPDKSRYLKSHVLTIISLFIPTFRVLRVFRGLRILRAARTIRSASLIQIITSLNRGLKTVRDFISGRGIGYVAVLSVTVVLLGAAAIYYFENPASLLQNGYRAPQDVQIKNYWDALWFSSMILTTIGSDYWPRSGEGRIVTFILSLYSFGVFGYITATIASFILGKESGKDK